MRTNAAMKSSTSLNTCGSDLREATPAHEACQEWNDKIVIRDEVRRVAGRFQSGRPIADMRNPPAAISIDRESLMPFRSRRRSGRYKETRMNTRELAATLATLLFGERGS